MAENNLPITDKYELEVNVGFPEQSLSQYFYKIVSDNEISSPNEMIQMVKKLVGRDIIVVHDSLGKFLHSAHENKITLSSDGAISINSMLGVAPDNLPPNVPSELTQELLEHLAALHEAEHATQFSREIDDVSGDVSIREAMLSDIKNTLSFERKFMREVDSDLSVIETLNDMGLGNVAQFWQDARANNSMIDHIYNFIGRAYEHDTHSTLAHFIETGDTIDPEEFISEKRMLVERIRGEMGVFTGKLLCIIGEYPNLETALELEENKQYGMHMEVKPQGIMHAVQTLLDDDQLDGMQKWEAENYMAAMDRLGYVADPNYDYEAQLRDVLENKMGLKTSDQIALEQRRNEAQGIVYTPIEQIF